MFQWGLTIVVLLPILLLAYIHLRNAARDSLREDVHIRSGSLLDLYRQQGTAAVARSIGERLQGPPSDKAYLLVDSRGTRLAGNLTQWPSGVGVPTQQATATIHRQGRPGSEHAWITTFRLPSGERLLIGSVALAHSETQYTMASAALATLLLMLPVILLVSGLRRRRLHKQVIEITSAATAFANGDLDRRITLEDADEDCALLVASLNRTADRLQSLVNELLFVTDALAHELRSPLTRLRAQFDKLGSADGGNEPAALKRARSEIDGMLRTINATLELSRAEAEGPAAFETVNVSELIRELWEVFEPSAEQKGVTLVLGQCDACECNGRRDLLAQAISNLLDNALKHSRATRIELACGQASGCWISVADNGVGIPEQDRGLALRKFGRLDRARTAPGSGLGLTFAQVVADLHGGDLELLDNGPGLIARISWR